MFTKFHTLATEIQAFWIFALIFIAIITLACITIILMSHRKQKQLPKGELTYSIYKGDKGEFAVFRHNPKTPEGIVLLDIKEKTIN